MSDEEDVDMMYDEEELPDEEDGEGGDDGEEGETSVENEYYEAKGMVEDDVKEGIKGFEKVISMEGKKGDWGFKALKKLTKLYFKANQPKKVVEKFGKFMDYCTVVTANVSEKGINGVLDDIGAGKDLNLTEELYTVALNQLQKSNNERVWFRLQLKLGKLLYDHDEHAKLARILQVLHKSCQDPATGQDDQKKGSQLVDIYALEIQMYTATKSNKKLKELYHQALEIKSAIPHPRIMGVIRECGGKMHMREKEWEKAHTDFFEAFKNYDEAGNPRRIQCLKYLLLANMLTLSEINPFDSTEAKPYKNDSEIVAMNSLFGAYERHDIKAFEKCLKDNKKTILDDSFMRDYIEDLLKNIRTQVLLKILTPYTKIRIGFLASELNITAKEVEDLMVGLILDSKIQGRIDQVNQLLELEGSKSSGFWKYRSVDKWATQLNALHNTVVARLN